MENIKELISLSQQVNAVLDDIGHEMGRFQVSNVSIESDGRIRVLVSPEMFFKNFNGFQIKWLEGRQFKFRLSKVIQGVEFFTLTNDLSGLKMIKQIERNGIKKGHKKSLRALQCG